MQSIFKEIRTLAEEERKQEFSFGFEVSEGPKKAKKKKKRKKKGSNSTNTDAQLRNPHGEDDSENEGSDDDEMKHIVKMVSDTLNVSQDDVLSCHPPGLSAVNTAKVDPVVDQVVKESDDEDDEGKGIAGPGKKKKKRSKKKKNGEKCVVPNQKELDDDRILMEAIAKAEADRALLSKTASKPKSSGQVLAKKTESSSSASSSSSGPRFVSHKDPTLDPSLKNKAKFGQGKNLVAVGPAKVRDSNWLQPEPAGVDGAPLKSDALAAVPSNNAEIKFHSSPFTFGFDGL